MALAPPDRRAWPRALLGWTTVLIAWGGAVGLTLLTVAAFAAQLGFPAEALSHLRLHFILAALLWGAACLAVRAPRACAACMVAGFLNLADAMATPPHAQRLAKDRPAGLTLIWSNNHRSERAAKRIVEMARAHDADIVMLAETNPEQHGWIGQQLSDYPCQVGVPVDGFTVTTFARAPCAALEQSVLGGETAGVRRDGWGVVGIHPARPDSRRHQIRRDAEIAAAAASVPAGGALVGDFNATPWSPVLRSLEDAGLRRVPCSGRFTATWLSRLPGLGLPIDHVFVREGVSARCTVGPDIGSDHYPLVVEFAGP